MPMPFISLHRTVLPGPCPRRRVVAAVLVALLCGAVDTAFAAGPGSAASAGSCLETARQARAPSRALAMAAAARQEHNAFGGQTMDAEGRLLQAGDSEAEDTRRTIGATPPWERVLGYWRAVDLQDTRLPYLVRFGALRPAHRELLLQALNQASADHLQGLGVGPDQGLASSEQRATAVALNRVAVIDTPWSAAFVSWLARQAGLGADEFAFSEAHADYAGAAWQAGLDEASGHATSYALRACDPVQTPPRIGDLLCQARAGSAGIDSFARIGEALVARRNGGAPLPMHCDVVVAVDATGFDTVGGNVLQSVTRRRLDFAAGTTLLDPSYQPEGCASGSTGLSSTPIVPGCVDRHMSRQPWSLLLQWR